MAYMRWAYLLPPMARAFITNMPQNKPSFLKKWSNPLSYRGFPRAFKHTCNKMQKLFASGSALKLTVNDYPLSLFIPLGFYLFGILTYPIIRIIHSKGVFEKM